MPNVAAAAAVTDVEKPGIGEPRAEDRLLMRPNSSKGLGSVEDFLGVEVVRERENRLGIKIQESG